MAKSKAKYLSKLKSVLQTMTPLEFEQTSARLVSTIIEQQVYIAKSGFQYGGDAGTGGAQNRYLRVECKRYKDSTKLSERELLGEIDQALERDPYLEAWILATPKHVSEQLHGTLIKKGNNLGVAVIFLSWDTEENPLLAAVCAIHKDCLPEKYKSELPTAPISYLKVAQDSVSEVKIQLKSWAIGYETIRQQAQLRLDQIWQSKNDSRAYFRQDVAGGDGRPVLKRQNLNDQINSWWAGESKANKPLALLGSEGVGKTFNTIAWLQENQKKLPIILLFSSGVFASRPAANSSRVENIIADELLHICNIRNKNYWRARVRRLLSRPEDEGFAFLFFIDGLNQEPSARWLDVFSQLQSTYFQGCISFIISTRRHTYTVALKSMRRLNPAPQELNVGKYDLSDGGEFDQLLKLHGIARSEITDGMLDIASIPRFFDLVVDMRAQLSGLEKVTFHRVLFEYGRDMRGRRDEKSFSDIEWQQWLIRLAKAYQAKIETTTERELSELTGGGHLTAEEIKIRNSDIIDGSFIEKTSPQSFTLDKRLVFHALGLDLLEGLVAAKNSNEMEAILEKWLAPLSGFDDESEILRASLSIALQDNRDHSLNVLNALLYAWLTSQNIPETHKEEIKKQAEELLLPLLEAVERSVWEDSNGALQSALDALETLNRAQEKYINAVHEKLQVWFKKLPLQIGKHGKQENGREHDKRQRASFVERIGTDKIGAITVLGYEFEVVETYDTTLLKLGAGLIQDSPLASYTEVFAIYAVWMSVIRYHELSNEFEWLCILNRIDPLEMREALRQKSDALLKTKPEVSINKHLPQRAARNLLFLLNTPQDERAGDEIQPNISTGSWDYKRDYLDDPSGSIFRTERRHAHLVLEDNTKPLISRIQKISDFIIDPNFEISEDVKNEAVALASKYDVSRMHCSLGSSMEDHQFETLSLLLARVSPERIAEHDQEWLASLSERKDGQRYASGIEASKKVLSANQTIAKNIRELRLKSRLEKDGEEGFISSNLMSCEIQGLSAIDQYRYVLNSEVEYLFDSLLGFLPTLSKEDVSTLVDEYYERSQAIRRVLLILLYANPPKEIDDKKWKIIEDSALTNLPKVDNLPVNRHYTVNELAFRLLAIISPERFGKCLDAIGWAWTPDQPEIIAHYGSVALTSISSTIPLIDIVSRVAPSDLAIVAEMRPKDEEDLQLIIDVLTAILFDDKAIEEPHALLTIDATKATDAPLHFNTGQSLEELEISDDIERLKRAREFSSKRQAIIDDAWERVRKNQREGASLYLRTVEARTLKFLIVQKTMVVDSWLEGLTESSDLFRSRVWRAEGFYISLCECLLNQRPDLGVKLWEFLFENLRTNIVGVVGIKYLFQIAFCSECSTETDALCMMIMSENFVQSDERVETLSILIRQGNRVEWVIDILNKYRNSDVIWERYLSIALTPLLTICELPNPTAWPEGVSQSTEATITANSNALAHKEACAFYWLKKYASAKTTEEANAAWILFVKSSSRRIRLWLVQAFDDNLEFLEELKTAFADEMDSVLERQIKKTNNFTNNKLFGKSVPSQLRPWVSGR